MLLDITKHGKASGGNILQTNTFGIGNIGVIIKILRSKMYANPIKVICQEIASNARDAHREVGCGDKPIEIKLPSRWDMTHRIRDFGPGITPDRMLNVFIRYGESTKRGNNIQNGGFGIGAKCPWSYSDMFTIVSITPENGKNICRKYTAEVSSSNEGKLILMSEGETDKPVGTEIIISCKDSDLQEFRRWTIEACQFWTVKPVITGVSDFEWPEIKKEFTGDRWFVLPPSGNTYSYTKIQPYALIDGIPYALNFDNMRLTELDTNIQSILNNMFEHPVYLEFDVGEIPVAASREEIDYNDDSIKKIQDCLVQLASDIVEEISQNIASCSDLWEANLAWKKIDYKYRELIGKAVWQGHPVSGNVDIRNNNVRVFNYTRNNYKQHNSYRHRNTTDDPNAFRKYHSTNMFEIHDKRLVLYSCENFSNAPNRRKLRTVFNDNPDIGQVIVLVPIYVDPDIVDPACKKNQDEMREKGKKKIDEVVQLYKFDCFDNYDKAKIVRNKNGQRKKSVTKIWSFIPDSGNSSRTAWKDEDIEIDKGTGIYVILNRKCASRPDQEDRTIAVYWLNQMVFLFDPGEILYGISKRQKANIGPGWISLETWMRNKIVQLYKSPDYVNAKQITNIQDNAYSNMRYVWSTVCSHWRTEIRNQTGLLAQFCEWSEFASAQHPIIKKIADLTQHMQNRLGVDVPVPPEVESKVDLMELWKKVNKAYPLLRTLGYDTKSYDIYAYVNSIDDRMRMNGEYIE